MRKHIELAYEIADLAREDTVMRSLITSGFRRNGSRSFTLASLVPSTSSFSLRQSCSRMLGLVTRFAGQGEHLCGCESKRRGNLPVAGRRLGVTSCITNFGIKEITCNPRTKGESKWI
jgi:hypothetical protein